MMMEEESSLTIRHEESCERKRDKKRCMNIERDNKKE
jgi:hypothetical protein